MYKIFINKKISPNSYLLEVEAPLIVNKALPGQFVIVMPKKDSERIPLTIYDINKENKTVLLIYQVVGATTHELSTIKENLYAIVGPLGNPNVICKNPSKFKDKRIVYVAGGVGIAPVYPQVKYLNNLSFKVDVIFGAKTKNYLIIRDEIEKVANKVYYATDDGSLGTKGNVCDILKEHIDDYDICVAIGPVIMMKFVSELTKKYNINTIVSMNPIMVDGTGMCGACRCEVDGKEKFACIDGPEFDGHKVNFDIALKRMNIYKQEEKELMDKMIGDKTYE